MILMCQAREAGHADSPGTGDGIRRSAGLVSGLAGARRAVGKVSALIIQGCDRNTAETCRHLS